MGPSFLAKASAISSAYLGTTTALALMHERLARELAPQLSLIVCEPPFPLPSMREMMQFHSARAADRGLSWLRARLIATSGGDNGQVADAG